MAIIGPSGSGKTTLLNFLAHRSVSSSAKVSTNSSVLINMLRPSEANFRALASYVESDDALMGSLTVRETLYFAARLSLSAPKTEAERKARIDELLQAFGLKEQAGSIVGTLVQKGISTGQKRRLGIAAQLISAPKILFLDEPTSGLDSQASYNVMAYVRDVAKVNRLLVVASIHQPSSELFNMFDKVLLLSGGKTCYNGPVAGVKQYFDNVGFSIPALTNPADFMLRLTNIDFERDTVAAESKISMVHNAWQQAETVLAREIDDEPQTSLESVSQFHSASGFTRILSTTWTLLYRSWVKSRRDVLVYGLRFGMYLGLAILMGTVWLRLPPTQASIQPFTNCILFGSTFMSFMAVVYVPAFIEDHAIFVKEHANGLYGITAFLVSNFVVGLPYLFAIALSSSSFVYWMANFRPSGDGFITWVMWMYLNLVAAESLVVLIAILLPNFIGALALTAMCNGIWMACNGFMVPPPSLNVFYRYVFYYINYQAYVFQGLVDNEFGYRNYTCGVGCYCTYDTKLRSECLIEGAGVLDIYGFGTGGQAKMVGITVAIIAFMRLMGWAVMQWRN